MTDPETLAELDRSIRVTKADIKEAQEHLKRLQDTLKWLRKRRAAAMVIVKAEE